MSYPPLIIHRTHATPARATRNQSKSRVQGRTAATLPSPDVESMHLPATMTLGTIVTSSGRRDTGESGPVVVEAHWTSGPWYRLASTTMNGGVFRIRWELPRRGLARVRIIFPNGDSLTGSTRVR